MSSAIAVLLNHNPQMSAHTLPVPLAPASHRRARVFESFYAFTGFTSATPRSERRLDTHSFGRNAVDLALGNGRGVRVGLYELLRRHTLRTGSEAGRAPARAGHPAAMPA